MGVRAEIEADEELYTDSKLLELKEVSNKKINIYRYVKRVIDVMGAIVGIIFLIPMTIVFYVLKLFSKDSEGPLFYDQLRIGKNGREFKLYKYRTMVLHADEKLYEYLESNPEANKEYKKYKKLKNDPRITKFGKVLRKTSLDEFPQFINVLKGEMSLVGPRPYLHREIEDMGENYEKIITVKPGVTGYWQVNGRSDVDFDERLKMDLYYIENESFILDMKILFSTILKIFKKNGAM